MDLDMDDRPHATLVSELQVLLLEVPVFQTFIEGAAAADGAETITLPYVTRAYRGIRP